MAQEQEYRLIITLSGEKAYFEVLDYAFEHHSIERANEIAVGLLEFPNVLKIQPYSGTLEVLLSNRTEEYRFLVYKRSKSATVKIIYYVDELTKSVYITDFFPTEMNDSRIQKTQD